MLPGLGRPVGTAPRETSSSGYVLGCLVGSYSATSTCQSSSSGEDGHRGDAGPLRPARPPRRRLGGCLGGRCCLGRGGCLGLLLRA